MNAMKKWMKVATPAEQLALASAADTSRDYLYQVAAGRRSPSADLADRLEKAASVLQKASKGRLPALDRTGLCPACTKCPYALKCLAKKGK